MTTTTIVAIEALLVAALMSVLVASGEELCGLEPPKDPEGGCGSPPQPQPQPPLDLDLMREYTKMSYTNKHDWEIRAELDAAEDLILKDKGQAYAMFRKILEEHPASPRAKYVLLNLRHPEVDEDNRSKAGKSEAAVLEEVRGLIEEYLDLVKTYVDQEPDQQPDPSSQPDDSLHKVAPSWDSPTPRPIMWSSVLQAGLLAESFNLTGLGTGVAKEGLARIKGGLPKGGGLGRWEKIHIDNLFLLEDWAQLEPFLEERLGGSDPEGKEKDPHGQLFLKFFKVQLLKSTGRKAEGNKLLRSLPDFSESYKDQTFRQEVEHLAQVVRARGRPEAARQLLSTASTLHMFLSPDQRPLFEMDGLSAHPVWNMDFLEGSEEDLKEEEEEVSHLARYEDELGLLRGNWEAIRDEAMTLSQGLSSDNSNSSSWVSRGIRLHNHLHGVVSRDGFTRSSSGSPRIHVYPLYTWGKRRSRACAKAKKLCAVLKDPSYAGEATTGCKVCTTKLVLLDPHLSTNAICGSTNAVLKAILPLHNSAKGLKLRISGQQGGDDDDDDGLVSFQDGKLAVIDGSFEHSFHNPSDEPALFLAADFVHPEVNLGGHEFSSLSYSEQGKQSFLFY